MNPLHPATARFVAASLGVVFTFSPAFAAEEASAAALAGRLSAIRQDGTALVRVRMENKGAAKETLQLQIKERRTKGATEVIYQVLWPKERKGESVLLKKTGNRAATGTYFMPPATTRPIDSADLKSSLLGSALSYEDVVENFFAWDQQAIVGNETVNGASCQILESKPGKSDRSSYGSVRTWVDPKRLVPHRVEKYSGSGQLIRRIDTTRVVVDDRRRAIPANLTVRGAREDSVTDIDGSRIKHGVAFDDREFSAEGMKELSAAATPQANNKPTAWGLLRIRSSCGRYCSPALTPDQSRTKPRFQNPFASTPRSTPKKYLLVGTVARSRRSQPAPTAIRRCMKSLVPASRASRSQLLVAAALGGLGTLFVARNFFPAEKKIRNRITADYHPGDDTFLRTMGNVLGPPLLEGNKCMVLQNGDEIFPAMLAAIRSAERTITFENFLLAEGEITDAFATALAERARAGVKVHFLQDAMGSNCIHGDAIALLERSGVQVEIFRFVHFTSINCRTHRKILIIDGHVGFIGGVGISDDWKGDGRTSGLWRDTHYQVEGPVVAQLQQAFIDNWLETRSELLHGDLYFPKLEKVGDEKCQIFKSSAGEGSDSARLMLLVSIAAAQKSIRIANAYFVPDDLCRRTLVEALHRGVQVEIITPGPDFDAPTVRAVGKARWKPLLEAGARFYEYQSARFHCKYLLVDDCWASVGSANLDNRSLSLNEEANLNVLGREWVEAHTRVFEEDKKLSREITLPDWNCRPFPEKVRGNMATFLRQQM